MSEKTIISILQVSEPEREWAAQLFYTSEPWTSLGVSLDKCRNMCNDREYIMFVAHIDQQACGAIILHPRGFASSPYLKSIVVAEEYRSQGVGAALLKYSEDYFRPNYNFFFLCVSSFNKRAQLFYQNLGYTVVGELMDYVVAGESEIIMQKRLK